MNNDYRFDTKALTARTNWCPLPAVHIKELPPKLKDFTEKLLKLITPSLPKSEFEGGIKLRCGTVISRPGFGKTELVKFLCKEVIKHYGVEKVNALSGKHLGSLITNFDDKPVQFLFVDDSTSLSERDQNATIKHYVTIRHDLKEYLDQIEKERCGVIDVIFSSHSFFMLKKQIRTLFNFSIMKSSDSNRYNRKIIIEEFGYHGLEKLDEITKKWGNDDMSVLNEGICSIIGEEEGGLLKFDYDPIEAAKIPWKEIIEEESFTANTSSKLIEKLPSKLDWGNFPTIFYEEMLKEYDYIKDVCDFGSHDNMRHCITLFFNKLFLDKSSDDLMDLVKKISDLNISKRSLRGYVTKVVKYFKISEKEFKTRRGQLQKRVSERWVIEGFSALKPLFSSHKKCRKRGHFSTNQSNDVCLHDKQGNHLLSINVKWYVDYFDEVGLSKSLEVTPECFTPPAALLVISNKTRQGEQAWTRFAITGEKEKVKIREVPLGGNGLILENIANEIENKLLKKKGERGKGNIFYEVAEQIEQLIKKQTTQGKKNI